MVDPTLDTNQHYRLITNETNDSNNRRLWPSDSLGSRLGPFQTRAYGTNNFYEL